MDGEQYSSQAVHLARKKLPPGAFKEVNRFLLRGPHEPRIFAVDGSKVHVHPSFLNSGYKTRTNDGESGVAETLRSDLRKNPVDFIL